MDQTREPTPEEIASLDAAARVLDADFARRMRLDAVSPVSSRPRRPSRRPRRRQALVQAAERR